MSTLLAELARGPQEDLGGNWEAWLQPGAMIGRFELVRELGRGGFGIVWEARDRELRRGVAFKAVRAGDRGPSERRRWPMRQRRWRSSRTRTLSPFTTSAGASMARTWC